MMAGADDKEWCHLAFLQREEKAPPRLCQKPSLGMRYMRKPWRVWLFYWVPAFETVQKTSLGYAGGKPNPLNPPYQGDFPLNSPLIRGARGVKNDERWVSYTVSFAGTTNIEFLHSLLRVKLSSMYGACVSFVDYLASKKKQLESQ